MGGIAAEVPLRGVPHMTPFADVPQLLHLPPTSLKRASDKYFDAQWRMPIAAAAAQLDGVITIRAVMEQLPGLDRSVGLRALDRLVELGVLRELPRAQDAAKNENREFVVNEDHVLWKVFAMIASFEGIEPQQA